MKPNRKSKPIKAIKIFTDREEPRKAFWNKYETFKKVMETDDCDVCILTYYGIGGIGKSSLLKKLQSEMDEKIKKPQYVYFDFYTYKDSLDALTRIAKKLSDDYKYTFPLFELGASIYKKSLGENYDPIGSKLVQKNAALGKLIKVLGIIPGADYATKLFELGSEAVETITKVYESHRAEVNGLKIMSSTELYDYLPYLFAKDIENNLKKATEPLVFFLDTYEVLVNEINQVGDALINDKWLRDEINGLVINTTKVFWVVAGREKLKWSNFNPDWENSLEQHLLGDLSSVDSDYFLETAGVHNAELRNQLYELTNGTPVYLDLCVDRYLHLLNCGEAPDISVFGHNTHDLIERFIRYMDDSHKDLIYMLTCLKNWDDEFVHDIAREVLPDFNETTFTKVKSYSFVIETSDNEYNIQQTVREVLFKSCPSIIKKKTGEALFEKFLPILEGEKYSEKYGDVLLQIAQAGILLHENTDALYEYYRKHIRYYVNKFREAGYSQQAITIIDFILDNTEGANKLKESYVALLIDKSCSYNSFGKYKIAREIAEKNLNYAIENLGENHTYTLSAMQNLAITLDNLGKSTEALELKQLILEKHRAIFGEDHPDTLNAMNNLATTLSRLGRYNEALELEQQILEKYHTILGKDHPHTISVMSNIASFYGRLEDRIDEALELEQQVLEQRRIILGENHPDTLNAMNNLAITLDCLDRYDEALELEQRVLEKYHTILGEDHPHTIAAMCNLAIILSHLGRYDKTLEIQQQALEKFRAILGEDHPHTIKSIKSLNITLRALGRDDEVIDIP